MSNDLFKWRPEPEHSRWNIKKRDILHHNPWYPYVRDEGVRDTGEEFEYFYVSIPFSVGVLAITPEGELVMVRQYRYLTSHDSLEVPGGTGVINENPEAIARRELLEETGFSSEAFNFSGKFDVSNGISNDVAHLFIALNCVQVQEPQHDVSEKGMRVELYKVAEVYEMARKGGIQDAFTLASLMLAYERLAGVASEQ